MADIFPVDTSGIDMANQVFNYYMPDASITGDIKILDQDYDTGSTLLRSGNLFMLGQQVFVHDIYIRIDMDGNVNINLFVTSDSGTTWTQLTITDSDYKYYVRAIVDTTIDGIKIEPNATYNNEKIYRIAAYAPEDATHPTEGQKFVIRQGGVPIHTHDFGNVSLESGVYETFEVYNTGSTILSGIRIYEVKDDNNDSNVYYKFSLDSSTWYDHSMTIDEPLYPSSGITFYAMVYAPSDASFGNNTIYFRVLAYDTGTEP